MTNITAIGDKLTVFLAGEIDHHGCIQIRQQVDAEILKTHPREIVLDFGKVTFMDSSGIGLIMGRYKLASSYGAQVTVTEASSYLKRVMRLAGLERLAKLEKPTKGD